MAVLDRKMARALVAEAQDRVREVADRYGMEVVVAPTAFEPSGRFMRLELRSLEAVRVQASKRPTPIKAQAKGAQAAKAQASRAVKTQAEDGAAKVQARKAVGLPKAVVGKTYVVDGRTFEVTALRPDRPAKPVSVRRDDGVVVAITAKAARRHLKTASA